MWREAEVLPCKRDFKNKMKKMIIQDTIISVQSPE